MSPKVKTSTRKTSKAKDNGRGTPYPSLANTLPPAKRLAKFLKATAGETVNAMTENEFESWLSKFPNLWPDDSEIDEFVSWLHKVRREGRYS